MKIAINFFILFLFVGSTSFAQSRFYKRLNGVNNTYEVKVEATPDGGWITTGFNSGSISLLKYDKCGILQWSKNYTSTAPLNYTDLVVSRFGGFALAGYYGPTSNADIYLLRLDAVGNPMYCKVYSGADAEHTYSLGEDDHGNFFINGLTKDCGSCPGNIFILKTDPSGNILWNKLYGESCCWALATVCNDGGVLRCGGNGNIYKVDSSGTLTWAKYGYYQAHFEPLEVNDGYVFPGYCSTRANTFKTDLSGNLLWITNQYLSASNSIQRATETSKGNVVIANNSFTIEFDKAGKYVNHNYFQDPSNGTRPNITDISRLTDNSIVIAGFESASSFNGRIDTLLHTGCADKNILLDTIPAYPLTIRDTSYSVVNKIFNTATVPVTVTNLIITEDIACGIYDSLQFTTSLSDTICNGESVNLSVYNQSPVNVNWNWYLDSCGGNLAGTGATITVSPSATQTYYIEAAGGCYPTACSSLTVDVNPKPVAEFSAAYSFDCSGVTVNLTNESAGANSYIWNFNDGYTSTQLNVEHELGIFDDLIVSLIAQNNLCRDTMTLQRSLASLSDYFKINVPNVFTPNNDGINDEFGISSDNDLSDCFQLTIFNRWGIEIFSSGKNNSKWDGKTTAGAKAVSGTYFYILDINGFEYKGQVSLIE